MTWAALILADSSPCLRWLTLTRVLGRSNEDTEVRELGELKECDPLFKELVKRQADDGSWGADDIKGSPHNRSLTTSQALLRLGFLGFDHSQPVVERAAKFLFHRQRSDGSWPLPDQFQDSVDNETYDMIPLQTAMPLRGLTACGYATHPLVEKAYDWLLGVRLEDGTWPTGTSGENLGHVAGYRRLPHSRWGCRSNTTAALCCLALHPERQSESAAQHALDLLLARGSQEAANLGFEVARIVGAEPYKGFFTYFARFDPGLLLWLCARIGASLSDPRVADLVSFIRSHQGPYGLWHYANQPQVSRWVTYDLLNSLQSIDESGDWVNLEPPTPFKPEPYGKHEPRH